MFSPQWSLLTVIKVRLRSETPINLGMVPFLSTPMMLEIEISKNVTRYALTAGERVEGGGRRVRTMESLHQAVRMVRGEYEIDKGVARLFVVLAGRNVL